MKIRRDKKNENIISKQSGMTLMELMISVALAGIVSVIAFQFAVDQNKESKKITDQIEYKIDTLLSDKVILKDLRAATPSINQLQVIDQNGHNFYDFTMDLNNRLLSKENSHQFRNIKIDNVNFAGKKFFVLVVDSYKGNYVFADPVIAFDVGKSSESDPNLPAPLTYLGLNRNNFLKDNNPKLLDSESLIYVDTSGLMKTTKNNPVPRSAAYVGFPDASGDLKKPTFSDNLFEGAIYTVEDSVDKKSEAYEKKFVPENFEQFLINVPPYGAGGSNIRIIGVKLIQYQLLCTPGTSKCDLERSEFTNKNIFEKKRIVLMNIKSVNFHRSSLSSTLVSISYEQNKENK